MKICEWNTDYSVNISELDHHHQQLFDILNRLFTLMAEGAEDRPIIRIIDELLDYTHYHFEEEEKIMLKMGYPDLVAHQRLHQAFIQQMKDFHVEADSGMAIFVATKIANLGLEWLKQHILTVDHKYAEFMKERGLQF
jgi:methyl-accepting chemotaxis protein/hemerythrin